MRKKKELDIKSIEEEIQFGKWTYFPENMGTNEVIAIYEWKNKKAFFIKEDRLGYTMDFFSELQFNGKKQFLSHYDVMNVKTADNNFVVNINNFPPMFYKACRVFEEYYIERMLMMDNFRLADKVRR